MIWCTLFQSKPTKSVFALLERPVFLEFLCDLEEPLQISRPFSELNFVALFLC